MNIHRAFGLAILFGSTLLASTTYAQTQNTVGACSPAIANIRGNISVTCIMPDTRVRIAHFSGPLDNKTFKKFSEFMNNNDGKIVFVDVYAGNDFVSQDDSNKNLSSSWSFQFDPKCGATCGGQIYNTFGKNSESALSYTGGSYYLRGYFIPQIIYGMHQGWVETGLEFVERQQVMFSSNYIP